MTKTQAIKINAEAANEAARPWYELYDRAGTCLPYCRTKAVVTHQRVLALTQATSSKPDQTLKFVKLTPEEVDECVAPFGAVHVGAVEAVFLKWRRKNGIQ